MRTGGRILVDNLLLQGVELAFCVPGESYLPVLDALYDARDRLRLIVCRQEGGAAYMAEAYGKLTGRPGIVFVTRGPGASNAAIGIHTAAQDSTPLIVFVGQVGSDFADREAFQEIDYRRMYGSIVKWVAQIEHAERIPEYVARAFRVAQSGRPGPVVLALPEDMLAATAAVADVARVDVPVVQPAPAQIAQLRALLAGAQRPVVIAGGSGWSAQGCANLARFAEANALPVACAFRNQDVFDNRHPNYAGDVGIGINPKLAARIRPCASRRRRARPRVPTRAGDSGVGRAGMRCARGFGADRRARVVRQRRGGSRRISRVADAAADAGLARSLADRRDVARTASRGHDPRQRRR